MALTTTITELCPYCSAEQDFIIDNTFSDQEYIEDCEVCCQPILCQIAIADAGEVSLDIRRENE